MKTKKDIYSFENIEINQNEIISHLVSQLKLLLKGKFEGLWNLSIFQNSLKNPLFIQLKLQKMFGADLDEQQFEQQLSPLELKNQVSTKSAAINLKDFNPFMAPSTSLPTSVNSFEFSLNQLETSLEADFCHQNANQIKHILIAYLKHCLNREFEETRAFEDGVIFCFQNQNTSEAQQNLHIDSLVLSHPALTHVRKQYILQIFKQYNELKGLFESFKTIFGPKITEEFIILLDFVIEEKLVKFKLMQKGKTEDLLPRISRYWENQYHQKITIDNWCQSNEYSYSEIKKLASEDIQAIGSSLYFSKKLKYLALITNEEMIHEVNLLEKFINLVSFVTANFLLTIAGIVQKDEDVHQFIKDLHFKTNVQGRLQEQYLNKKIKNQ